MRHPFPFLFAILLPALATAQFKPMPTTPIGSASESLTIEVWSDVVCP